MYLKVGDLQQAAGLTNQSFDRSSFATCSSVFARDRTRTRNNEVWVRFGWTYLVFGHARWTEAPTIYSQTISVLLKNAVCRVISFQRKCFGMLLSCSFLKVSYISFSLLSANACFLFVFFLLSRVMFSLFVFVFLYVCLRRAHIGRLLFTRSSRIVSFLKTLVPIYLIMYMQFLLILFYLI